MRLLDRWSDATSTSAPGWVDRRGRSPLTLYLEYLIRRRKWEEHAWKAGGSQKPAFSRLMQDLAILHGDLSSPASLESRDNSIVKPPSRDPRTVKVVSVDRNGDDVEIRTLEEEFEGLLPIGYRIVVGKSDGCWQLIDRVTDQEPGRQLHRL